MYRITRDQVCNNLYSQIGYNTKYVSLSLILMNNKYIFRMKFTLFWSIKYNLELYIIFMFYDCVEDDFV
jgi:hypothetical protein